MHNWLQIEGNIWHCCHAVNTRRRLTRFTQSSYQCLSLAIFCTDPKLEQVIFFFLLYFMSLSQRLQLIYCTPRLTLLSAFQPKSQQQLLSIRRRFFPQICDRFRYPTVISLLGNICMATAFLLIGPAYFMPFETSLPLIQGSMGVIGLSYGLILVSTYGRSQRAAIRNGYNDDMDTYLIISGNASTT